MRILLDNCVSSDLASHIRGHEVATAVHVGWDGLDDGPLLDAMTGQYEVLVTVDKSIPYQQLVAGRPVAVLILRVKSNRVGHLARLIPAMMRTLKEIAPGEVREISE